MFWKSLWSNVGKKLKIVAKVFFVLMVIGCIVGGIVLIAEGSRYDMESLTIYGVVLILFGPIVFLIMLWGLYAFGQLVDDVAAIKSQLVPDDNADLDVKGRLKFLLRQNLISKEEYDALSGGVDEED